MESLTDRITDLERRVERVEIQSANRKPWFLSKGVMGPLVSGAATVALCVGYIAVWPADAMAIIAAVAGGGSITGIIGRATAKGGVR